jgi:hypothetical protein
MLPCSGYAVPLPCHSALIHIYHGRTPATFQQCRVLHESPRCSRKFPNRYSYSLTDWYASDNNLRGTPRGSRKKPNAVRSPTCRLWKADANSHIPWHAAPMPRCAVALRSRFQNSMVVAGHGCGMACESNTAALCKPNWKDTI